ncbi:MULTISPECIES: restriction endonuclease subunit S [Enterobacter cloacae complex]|uniref:restriction endonuclease subunit S n=1 Tax=Enterobacter cloacae complex TaxID=354276 RepID=UPI00064AC27A|nr:restriction endonuclease subunit S [Enterobacter hormaechei]HBV8968641.1 restriction endonuclease subunit S [Klebsiella oxytoca]EJB8196484.1 restriction endonuclease subunit S [Enterobacter hormaechei]EKU5342773.1 restriction endonuclease subunit S [Enterobacter hormaechei]EKU5347588.1 restriction endonuclease subunit S [Enterobacter hormaechei]EKU5424261.1 restriction endonuclease subunit S [Enterobacter hormaechei]
MIAPKLRFSIFSQEWTKIRLGDYLQIYQKKVSSDTNIPVYSSSRQGLKPQAEYFADRELKNDGEYGVVPLGYITYRHMSDDNTFHFNLNDKISEIAVSKEYPVFTGKGLNNHFLLSKLNYTNEFKLFAIQQKAGGTRTRLYFKNLCEWYATFPAFEEQTKIADFISAIDKKITLLNSQYEQLIQFKKGMMQKIFSQELRFEDDNGTLFPEWSILQLKDVATRVTRKNKENNNTILTISGRDGLVDQMTYFNKQIASKNVTGYYLIKKGEFAYNKSYSQGYPMGAIKMLSNYEKGVVSTLYICFKLNDEQSCDFYQHYFESGLQNRAIEKVAQEGARNHGLLNIGVNDFFDIELQVPGLAEQNKIAHFLSAIDDKITTKKTELDKLKTWKQGLLQQMFV